MQHQSITRANATGLSPDALVRSILASPVLMVLIFALAVLALNPIGYKGGGADDWQYLKAARCAAEQGFCFPENHWWRRFAIVFPAGLTMRLFGEDVLALAMFPLAYSLGAIGLFVWMMQRQFGPRQALIGGILLAATPVIGERLIEINIDMAELFFFLASVACLQSAHRGGRTWLFVGSGALLSLAVLARPTQLALLPIYGAAFWLVPGWRSRALPFLAGFLAPILVEAAIYGVLAGDMLLSWKLSAAHTRIPSTELATWVDVTQTPLFNVSYIAGWKPAMGISVHWTVNGLLNLLVHPGIGLSLLSALVLLGLDARWLRSANPHARVVLFLVVSAMAFFGALVFAFAIDPKPRMFLPVLVVAAAAFGVLAAERLRTGQVLLVAACMSLIVGRGVVATLDQMRIDPVAATAADWAREDPHGIAVTSLASSLMTLTPEVKQLPVEPANRPKLLVIGLTSCEVAAGPKPGWRLVRERLHSHEPGAMRKLRDLGIFLQPEPVIALCLFQRA